MLDYRSVGLCLFHEIKISHEGHRWTQSNPQTFKTNHSLISTALLPYIYNNIYIYIPRTFLTHGFFSRSPDVDVLQTCHDFSEIYMVSRCEGSCEDEFRLIVTVANGDACSTLVSRLAF